MRRIAFAFLSKRTPLFFLVFTLFLGFIKSQEKGEGESSDLTSKLNVAVAEIHRPKFQKTPKGGDAKIDESEMSYDYYGSTDEWMEISFRYSIEDYIDEGEAKLSKEERKLNPSVPEVTFKIYIEGISKSGKKESTSVLLGGEATYLNVKKTDSSSKYRYGIFFVTPEAVEFYGLKELFSATKGNIRVEAYIGDKKAVKGKNSEESFKDLKENDADWEKSFKSMTQIKNMVLTKDMTPWINSALEKFPMLKIKGSERK